MNPKRIVTAGGGYPFAVVAVAVTAVLLVPLRGRIPSPTVMLLFVPVIIGVSRVVSVRASAFAAAFAFVSLDFIFIPPYYRLTVASPSEWVGLFVFLVVALVSGQQTVQLRDRERSAVRRRDELALLNRLSSRIVSESGAAAVADFIASQVAKVLGAQRVALYAGGPVDGATACLAQAGLARCSRAEAELVDWVMRTSKAVGLPPAEDVPYDLRVVSVGAAEAIPGTVAQGAFIPLQTSTSLEGVLFVEPAENVAMTDDDVRLLAAVANLAATSFERQRLEEDAAHTEALREADRLKSTLVSSVSHELKTPLAAATARVTGLIDEGDSCDAARVGDELAAVAEDLDRLNDSIGDLLDLSRLESEAWEPRFEAHDVRDILGTVLSRLPATQRDRLHFDLAGDLPDVRADYAQLARALSNVIENALAYSPDGSEVSVSARYSGDIVELAVEDSGPGVPDVEKASVFEKFYRGQASASAPSGTGLGLAIAREIVRTHGGTVRVEDVRPHGARFVLTIPASTEETA
jgi:two-component system, OmpR family, sensor histidine kinase KdpD